MRKLYCLGTLVITLLCFTQTTFSQDFSNKGKVFWLCFPAHVPSGNVATLSIWITSDRASSGTVKMTNGAFNATFNIAANGLQEIQIPHALAHVSNGESFSVIQKSIKIETDPGKPPVVAYAQQWGNARSAATLLLPVNVLGKTYYSVNFAQTSQGKSQFQVIATRPNTSIKITPRLNGVVQTALTVNLPNEGDMYQYQADQDLTGTLIESIASASGGCVPIAVFSGSSNATIGTPSCTSGNSYDPLLQQQYPVSSWGKNFGFVPFADYNFGSNYRVLASENGTNVYFDGSLVAVLNAGQIYPNNYTNNPPVLTQPTSISADKPIMVAQYAPRQNCTGGGLGDPDMVILNPIEQNIGDITIFSSTQQNISRQWINVVIKSNATSSFTINGVVPVSLWQNFPALPGYSYLRHLLPGAGSYRLKADSAFNAIAYGFGDVESYSYSAGTNVRDLYQQIGVATEYGIEPTPSVCVGAPFKFKVSLPYQADSIYWDLSLLPGAPPNVWMHYPPSAPDSTTVINGKTIYWYSLPAIYSFAVTGQFPVTIFTYAPNVDGCGNEQEIPFELTVSEPPVADFSFTNPACAAVPVQFTETTPQIPKPTYAFWWDFGDPASGANNNSNLRNPLHTFSGPGTYTVRFADITTPGCLSDTIEHQVTIPPMPTATITGNASVCVNGTQPLVTFTGAGGTAPYEFTYNINGGPNLTVTTTSGNSVTVSVPTTTAGSFVYNLVSVKNPSAAACTQAQTGSVTINVLANPIITLTSAANTNAQTVCLNAPITNITYTVVGPSAGATVTGLPAGVTGSFSGGVVTITGTPSTAGTFNYSVNGTSDCGAISAAGTITVSPNATVSLTSAGGTSSQTVCINTAITNITYSIGGSGTGATVTGLPAGVTGVFSGGILTISGTPTVSGTFNYTVNSTGPCVNTSMTGSITVNPNAVINLTSGSSTQAVCVNVAIGTITYQIAGGATGASVTGLPAGVTGVYNAGTFTISGTPTTAGTYNFTVSANGSCGPNTQSGTLVVNPDASLILTSAPSTNNQNVCINTALVNITYSVGGGGSNASVTGLPAGISGSFSGGVFTISGTPTGTGTFNYTITTTGTCNQTTASGTITVAPNATISLTSPANTNSQTLCVNTAITPITYAVSGGGTNANVSGLPAGVTGIFNAGIFTISGTASAAGVFNYTVNTTGSCGQTNASGTITVNDDATLTLSSASATTAQEVCLNSAITTITYITGGGATGATVSGLPAGVTGVYAGNVMTISGTPAAAGSYNYTVTTQGPCVQKTLTGTINVNLLPDGNFGFTAPGCETQTVTFTDNSVANSGTITGWSWNFGDPSSGANNTSSQQNPTHIFATPGTYTVTLTVTTDKGCSSAVTTQSSQSVVINPKPEASFTAPVACSADVTAQFTDGSSNAVSWQWNFGDPNANAGNPNTSAQQNPTHHYTVPGAYTAELIVTNSQGCKDTTTRNFFVNGSPTAQFSINNTTALCSNEEVRLTDNSSVDLGSMVKIVIYWDYLNDPTNFITVNNPLAGAIYTFNYPEFGAPASRSYRVRLEAYTGTSCVSVFTQDITLLATPTLEFDPVPGVCGDVLAFQVTQASMTNGLLGNGVFTGPGITADGLFNPATAGAGIHTIRYTYNGNNGCSNYIEQTIEVFPVPPTNAGPDKVVLEGGQVTLTPAMNASMPVTYLWTPPIGIANPNISNAVVSPPYDITYTLTVTSDKGCVKSDQVFVKVLKNPVIPNIFSPNGDGVHDKWEIAYLETYPGCTVDIYNRYGQLVYHSLGYSQPWDGTIHGKPVPIGTYYYIVNPKNGRQQLSGYVDVIR